MVVLTYKYKLRLILKIVLKKFPETNEGFFYYSIVERAVRDLLLDRNKTYDIVFSLQAIEEIEAAMSARMYLSKHIYHAEVCGVDSDWIRNLFKDMFCLHLLKPIGAYKESDILLVLKREKDKHERVMQKKNKKKTFISR